MVDMSSFSELFSKEMLLRIPVYQRGYAWQIQQIADFWEDVVHLDKDCTHYAGMITLKELNKDEVSGWEKEKWVLNRKYAAYHVVDGQQRLTTFVILINSIIEYAEKNDIKELGIDAIDSIREKYICKKHNNLSAYKFGYEKDNPSFEYLQYRIFNEEYSGEIQESFYTYNLKKAKEFFDEQLTSHCKGDANKLNSIFDKITTCFLFITHYIDSKFDIHVAFETMNNRGKRLSNLELLKNRLMYLNSLLPNTDDNSLYEKIQTRNSINDAWGKIYENLGRNPKMLNDKSKNDDELLRTHWIIYFKYSRYKGEDYASSLLHNKFTINNLFKDDIQYDIEETDDPDDTSKECIEDTSKQNEQEDPEDFIIDNKAISDYINSLQKTSVHWYYISYPRDTKCKYSEDEVLWLERLNRLGMNYFKPLVIASFLNDNISSDQRIKLFMAIERFIMLIFRMGHFMSNFHSNIYYTLANLLHKGEIKIEDVTYHLNQTFIEKMAVCMDTFKARMMELHDKNEGFYSWSTLKYLMFEYEAYLSEKTKESRGIDWDLYYYTDKDDVSIEHIYPQTPTDEYWTSRFNMYNIEERKRLTNSLGNLLPLSQSINSSLQNIDFISKVCGKNRARGYLNGSRSEREVALNYGEPGWDPRSIEQRGLNLLKFIEERWKITFKNESQRYNILGISFLKNDISNENTGKDKLEQVKKELLGDYEPQYDENHHHISNIYDFDPNLSYTKLVKITYNGEVFKTKVWYDGFIHLMKRLAIDNRQYLESICDKKNLYRRFPTITKNEDDERYSKLIDDYYVFSGHSGAGFMKEVKRFLELLGINNADIIVEYTFVKGREPKE